MTEICTQVENRDGVEIATEVRSISPWDLITTIDVTEEHAFFEVGKAGWLILPRRAFPDEKEFLRFVATAHQFKANQEKVEVMETGIMDLDRPGQQSIQKQVD